MFRLVCQVIKTLDLGKAKSKNNKKFILAPSFSSNPQHCFTRTKQTYRADLQQGLNDPQWFLLTLYFLLVNVSAVTLSHGFEEEAITQKFLFF